MVSLAKFQQPIYKQVLIQLTTSISGPRPLERAQLKIPSSKLDRDQRPQDHSIHKIELNTQSLETPYMSQRARCRGETLLEISTMF